MSAEKCVLQQQQTPDSDLMFTAAFHFTPLALPTGCVNCADSRFDVDVLYFKRILHMNTDSLQRKLTSNMSINTWEKPVRSYTIKNSLSHSLKYSFWATSKLSIYLILRCECNLIWINQPDYIWVMSFAFSVNNNDGLTRYLIINLAASLFFILQPISFCLLEIHSILNWILIIHKPVRKILNKPWVNFLTRSVPDLEARFFFFFSGSGYFTSLVWFS